MEELEGLNLTELVERMVAPIEPPPVSLWPQTIGWLVVAGFVCGVAMIVGAHAWVRYRRNAYRRAALRELAAIEADSAGDARARAARVAGVVKRAALVAYPRPEVAGLYGAEWRAFLERSAGTRLDPVGLAGFGDAAYRDGTAADLAPMLGVARAWIGGHGG